MRNQDDEDEKHADEKMDAQDQRVDQRRLPRDKRPDIKGPSSLAAALESVNGTRGAVLIAKGDFEAARRRHYQLLPLFKALFVESNPVPVKACLELLGRCSGEVRLPLVAAEEATRAVLRKALGSLGARVAAV
jgi:hypothetical protein